MRKWEKDTDTKSFSLVLPLSLSLTNLHAQRERERERAASKREQVSENDASKLIEKRTFKKQLIVEIAVKDNPEVNVFKTWFMCLLNPMEQTSAIQIKSRSWSIKTAKALTQHLKFCIASQ